MKVIIHPDFKNLSDFIHSIPKVFYSTGNTIYKGRNEVKIFEINKLLVNVKKYKRPIWLNQFVYSFFRKSKAERAYQNALTILKKGFHTPQPIAYIEIKKYALLKEAYFICLQSPYKRDFKEFVDTDIKGREHIIEALGIYTAKMHQKDIYHLDFSIGNILFEDTEKSVNFSIIDLNRMKFLKINENLGYKNFQRLCGNEDFFRVLAKAYAQYNQYDEKKSYELISSYHLEYQEKSRKKKKFKALFRKS